MCMHVVQDDEVDMHEHCARKPGRCCAYILSNKPRSMCMHTMQDEEGVEHDALSE